MAKELDNYGVELVSSKDLSVSVFDARVRFNAHEPRKVNEKYVEELLSTGLINYVHDAPPPPEPELEPEVVEEDPLVVALEGLIEEGDPENFKKDGTPKAAVVNKLAGRAVTTEEREAAWQTALNR